MMEQLYYITTSINKIENTTDKAKTVTIETNFDSQKELFETRAADSETHNEKRWRVSVPAKKTVEFPIKWRVTYTQRHQLRSLQFAQVQKWAEKRYLDQDTFEELSELLRTLDFIEKTRKRVETLGSERKDIYEKQEQLRANLGALQPEGKEATLRNRVLKQLETTQDRLESIEREVAAAKRTIEESDKRIEDIIKALGT